MQKLLVIVPERFKTIISALENSKNLSTITLVELLHALHAQEQRNFIRQEGSIEGVLQAKLQVNQGDKGKKKEKNEEVNCSNSKARGNDKKTFLLVNNVGRKAIHLIDARRDQMLGTTNPSSWGISLRYAKINHIKLQKLRL